MRQYVDLIIKIFKENLKMPFPDEEGYRMPVKDVQGRRRVVRLWLWIGGGGGPNCRLFPDVKMTSYFNFTNLESALTNKPYGSVASVIDLAWMIRTQNPQVGH